MRKYIFILLGMLLAFSLPLGRLAAQPQEPTAGTNPEQVAEEVMLGDDSTNVIQQDTLQQSSVTETAQQ